MQYPDMREYITTQVETWQKTRKTVSIEPVFDLLLSLRHDSTWRRETVKASAVQPTSGVLDVCTGTGELALAYADKIGTEGFVIASDFCFEMLVIGDRKLQQPVGAVSNRPISVNLRNSFLVGWVERIIIGVPRLKKNTSTTQVPTVRKK